MAISGRKLNFIQYCIHVNIDINLCSPKRNNVLDFRSSAMLLHRPLVLRVWWKTMLSTVCVTGSMHLQDKLFVSRVFLRK